MSAMTWKAPATQGRGRRAVLLAAVLAGAGVLAAGCANGSGSPRVAVASTSPAATAASASASPSSGGSAAAQALAYATCMRSHGVPGFPDPTVQNGAVGFDFTGANVDQNSAQYQSARQACQGLRPGGTSNSGTANYAAELKFSKCMRAHGVPDFPDPNKNGGFSGTSSVNPSSQTFQNTQSLCMQLSGLGSGSKAAS